MNGKIPDCYIHAEWRNTTPLDSETQRIGVGFDLEEGKPSRLSLSLKSAENLKDTLCDYLKNVHSAKSYGIPSLPGSIPDEGEKVCPPETSSAAFPGEL